MSTLVSEGSPTSAIGVGCCKMFENLTNKLETILSKLKNAPSLTKAQVDSGLKEIRLALLEADVALSVAKEFIEKVKNYLRRFGLILDHDTIEDQIKEFTK